MAEAIDTTRRNYSPVGERDADGDLYPPWIEYPNVPRRSIGWRMGFGEVYWCQFAGWWKLQTADVRQRVRAKYPDAGEWAGFWEMAERSASRKTASGSRMSDDEG